MSKDSPKEESKTPPDYEYGNLKLKYLPPPPDLEEGQVYVRKREFANRVGGMYKGYFRENPLVPLSLCTMFASFVAGVTYQVKRNHQMANRMMFVVVGSQFATLISYKMADKKMKARKQNQSEQEFMLGPGNK